MNSLKSYALSYLNKGTLSTFLVLKKNFVVELYWFIFEYFYKFCRKNIVFYLNQGQS